MSFPGDAIAAIAAGAAFTIGTAYSSGTLLLRPLVPVLSRLEFRLFSFLIGSLALSSLVFLLAALHLALLPFFALTGAVALGLFVRYRREPTPDEVSALKGWRWNLFLIIYSAYGLLYLCNAFAPEFSPDGAAYHLGNVVRWHADHGFTKYTGSLYANWSQGLEMLFLFGFPIGGHSSAAVVHLAYLLTLPWLFLAFGKRFGQPWPMLVAGMLLYVSPVAGRAGTSAYVDMAVACVLLGMFYALQLWKTLGDKRLLYLAASLAGFGYCLKYTAGLGLLYGIGFIVWRSRSLRDAGIFAGIAMAWMAPWLIKNVIWLGNPFSPFANAIFPNPYIHIDFEREYVTAMALYPEIKSRWLLPLYYAFKGSYVGGVFGPWILLLPVGLLGLRQPLGRQLLLFGSLLGLTCLANCGTRFLIPAAVFWAASLCVALPRLGLALLVVQSILSLPFVIPRYVGPSTWYIEGFPWREALRLVDEPTFLSDRMFAYPLARLIDQHTPPNAKVFTLTEVPKAYTSRRMWHTWQSGESVLAHQALLGGRKPVDKAGWDIAFRIPPVRLNSLRVVAANSHEDELSICEIAVLRFNNPVSGWTASARPNPWDADLVLDGNELTAWTTWEPTRVGMFLEIRLPRLTDIDQVRLIAAGGQWKAKWRLEGQTEAKGWQALSSEPAIRDRTVAADSRRAATRALQAMGFTHVVAGTEDDLERDLIADPERWGMEVVARSRALTLLRLL